MRRSVRLSDSMRGSLCCFMVEDEGERTASTRQPRLGAKEKDLFMVPLTLPLRRTSCLLSALMASEQSVPRHAHLLLRELANPRLARGVPGLHVGLVGCALSCDCFPKGTCTDALPFTVGPVNS